MPTHCVGQPVTVLEDDFLRCHADEPMGIQDRILIAPRQGSE